MDLAVVASMKRGFEQFIHREICALADRGARIHILPAKQGPGLYGPRPDWIVHRWRVPAVLWSQPWRFLRQPIKYLAVLFESLRYGAVVDFLLAAYFVPHVRGVDAIYATFGDRKLFVAYFCRRLTNKPLAVEIHAYELYQNPNPRLFATALAACERVIAATQYNRDLLCQEFGVEPGRVEVVRYSLDLDEYRPQQKFVVLIVAFFVEKKGHDTLFRAVKKMGRDDVEVWVVGGSGGATNEVDVRALAACLGIESQVAFFGKLGGTALKAVYHACDVFCLPSRFDSQGEGEGFPNVLIEAMACGKPVITTRHVEIPRIVEQMLVDENDVEALVEALETTYRSAELRRNLGARNRELAERHFSLQNVDATFEILRSIAGKGNSAHDAEAPKIQSTARSRRRRAESSAAASQATASPFN